MASRSVVRSALLLAVEAGGGGTGAGSAEGGPDSAPMSFATAGAGSSACELLGDDGGWELFGASARHILPTSSA
jgi:hypothetical protein